MEGAWFSMKLKYYLRGAGIALILAVLLTNVSHRNEVSASSDIVQSIEEESEDEDTIAKEENITLAEASKQEPSTEGTVEPDDSELALETDANIENMTTVSDKGSEVREQGTELITEEMLSEQVVAEENQIYEAEHVQTAATLTIEADAHEAYLLNVVSGDDSGTVSRKLYNAGLVDSASEFDAYLMQHGYDKKIRVGTVEIPFGATWLEIAEKLAGK